MIDIYIAIPILVTVIIITLVKKDTAVERYSEYFEE